MTDQELAQECARRLWAREAALQAVLDSDGSPRAKTDAKRSMGKAKKAHVHMAKAHGLLMSDGLVQSLTGSPIKP